MRPITILILIFALLATTENTFAAGGSGGSSGGGLGQTTVSKTPEQRGADAYFLGVKKRDKGVKFEIQAAEQLNEKKRLKLISKAQKEYGKAQKYFLKALKQIPGSYEAYSDLGFVYRKTGQLDNSMSAYNKALSLNPGYTPAIEYRGEAYLELARLDEAKEAYLQLFRTDRENAQILLNAMQKWLAGTKSSALSSDAKASFTTWVLERVQISQQTSDLRPTNASDSASRWQASSTL